MTTPVGNKVVPPAFVPVDGPEKNKYDKENNYCDGFVDGAIAELLADRDLSWQHLLEGMKHRLGGGVTFDESQVRCRIAKLKHNGLVGEQDGILFRLTTRWIFYNKEVTKPIQFIVMSSLPIRRTPAFNAFTRFMKAQTQPLSTPVVDIPFEEWSGEKG